MTERCCTSLYRRTYDSVASSSQQTWDQAKEAAQKQWDATKHKTGQVGCSGDRRSNQAGSGSAALWCAALCTAGAEGSSMHCHTTA